MSNIKKISVGLIIVCVISFVAIKLFFNGASTGIKAAEIVSLDFESNILNKIKEVTVSDEKYLLVGSTEGKMSIISSDLDTILDFQSAHKSKVTSVSFAPTKDLIVSADEDGTIVVWDVLNEKISILKKAHVGDISDIAFSPDGKYFATASKDRMIKVWDASELTCITVLKGHKSYVSAVDWSPNGKNIASVGADNKLIIWDVESGKMNKEKNNSHYRAVQQVKFSPDGKYLYTSSTDSLVKIWDFNTLECLKVLEGHSSEVLKLAISNDGTKIFSAGRDKSLVKFDVNEGAKEDSISLENNVYVSGIEFLGDDDKVYVGDISGYMVCIDYEECKIINQKKIESIYSMTILQK